MRCRFRIVGLLTLAACCWLVANDFVVFVIDYIYCARGCWLRINAHWLSVVWRMTIVCCLFSVCCRVLDAMCRLFVVCLLIAVC